MPSFDIVSKLDEHELTNAVDQANREVSTRFDFKGTDARFELKDDKITMIAPSDFQLKQMRDILEKRIVTRNIDIRSLTFKDAQVSLHEARQIVEVKQGIDTENAKKISKLIKEQKTKVQVAIQGDEVRVTGKKRDDLQEVISFLREQKVALPLQFENFRD